MDLPLPSETPHVPPGDPDSEVLARAILDRWRSKDRSTLILDYDGTLVPLAARPELAAPDDDLLALLRRLGERTRLHIVSGRPRADLERWLGALPLGLHAEHGFWSRPAPAARWMALLPKRAPWKEEVRTLLGTAMAAAPGSFLEEKTACLAWHYRACETGAAAKGLAVIDAALGPRTTALGLEVLHGAKVVEVRPRGLHKGRVVPMILDGAAPDALVLAAGDDSTDEDLFGALPADAITIHVGDGPSRATFRVASPRAMRALLTEIGAM